MIIIRGLNKAFGEKIIFSNLTQVSGLLYWLEHCSPLLKWQSFSQILCGLKKQISQSP